MLLLWLLALDAGAQSRVYKCIGGATPVYQQTPCQGQAEWRWEIPVEASQPRITAAPASPRPRSVRGRSQPMRRAPVSTAGQGGVIGWASDTAACNEARRLRGQRLAASKRLDYLQRRQLDDAVHAACR
ncbi:hypothetical protein [Stenotrophomonas sp. 24(2023)]|uniref:hypothetical protein n=1 Tax=Stenotrophomonas sp. 24(2023) TaxID=3068324 RepID=UPI0027E0095D|nr:hypothetical protein [Stenotrophomonas sp. 24(2023)]WMJ69501.1 hypothetical protein Q9R17_20365 [Stenotrophomonas sp. 24(2023)]